MTPAQHHLLDQALRPHGVWTTEEDRPIIIELIKRYIEEKGHE